MPNQIERLIKGVYKKWKSGQRPAALCPDEETLACFLEGRLGQRESQEVEQHLIACCRCAETLAIQAKLEGREAPLPAGLLQPAKDLVADKTSPWEIFLRAKEKMLELLSSSGDILIGQELVPVSIFRSRQIKDFKDEITILKDFKDIRVEIKVENKGSGMFNLTVSAKEKANQKVIKDLRISLFRESLELESYHTDSGRVTFEHVLLGKYTIEVTSIEDKFATVLLDIKT